MSEERACQKCGRPENDHPYRHPFVAMAGSVPRQEQELTDLHARLSAAEERAEALAYIGEERFPDLTYKARLEELVPDLRRAEAERDEARRERDEARKALAFAASVIKSGEPWTATCEEVIGGVLYPTEKGRGKPFCDCDK